MIFLYLGIIDPIFDFSNPINGLDINNYTHASRINNFDTTLADICPPGAREFSGASGQSRFTKLVRPRKIGYVHPADQSRYQFYIKFKLYILARFKEFHDSPAIYTRGFRGRM